MENWRVTEELDYMKEWDPDAVLDALNITTTELFSVPWVVQRAVIWIEENNE